MENKEKYLRTNKRLKIGIIVFSILSVVMLVGNKSYALFNNTVKTNNPVVTINTASEFPPKGPTASGLAKYILDKAYSNTSELVAIDVTDKSNIKKCASIEACAGKEIEYRYIGPTVNNYVYLKSDTEVNEKWRIIGLFLNDAGTEWNVKIVRDEVLPDTYLPTNYVINDAGINGVKKKVTYTIKYTNNPKEAYWNKNNSGTELSRWEEAGLQYYLNTEKDDSGSNRGFLSRLSPSARALLVDKKTYYLGTVHTYIIPYDTPKEAYMHERDVASCVGGQGIVEYSSYGNIEKENSGCHVWSGNASTWTGQVALMYLSDYGLSASEANWTTPMYYGSRGTGFEDADVNVTTWMYSTMADSKIKYSWFLSPSSYSINYASNYSPSGGINIGMISGPGGLSIRPVVYLSSSATRLDGEGNSSSPYVILS